MIYPIANDDPLITAIIPTFKRPELLKRAIKSVLNQSFKPFQVCVYDNASGDETRDVVESFVKKDSRVKYFCHETNIGGVKNFQYGLEAVNTPYFSFLSDDDILFPNFYELAIEGFHKYPKAAIFSGNCYKITSDLQKLVYEGFKLDRYGLYHISDFLDKFKNKDFVPWTSMVFNYDKVKKIKLDDSIISDVMYFYQILSNYPIIISPFYCSVFFISLASASSHLDTKSIYPGMKELKERLEAYQVLDCTTIESLNLRLNNMIMRFIISDIKRYLKENNFVEINELIALLQDEFHAKTTIDKINIYCRLRKISVLWYFLLYSRKILLFLKKIRLFSLESLKTKRKLKKFIKSL